MEMQRSNNSQGILREEKVGRTFTIRYQHLLESCSKTVWYWQKDRKIDE